MHEHVKVALILAVTAIAITCLKLYFSPFQSCARENDVLVCSRLLGSQVVDIQ